MEIHSEKKSPIFELDEVGRVLCKNHTKYVKFKLAPSSIDILGLLLRDKKLTCKTCEEYISDNCYFSKSLIDKIIHNKSFFRRKFKCDICKSRINLVFNILYKYYLEQYPKKEIRISSICCGCFHSLKSKDLILVLDFQCQYVLF